MNIIQDLKLKLKLYAVYFTITLVNGGTIKTYFERTFGNGVGDMTCARDAVDRSYLATMIDDTSNTCTRLERDWGLSHDAGSTYFEKKRVVEIYDNPLVLGDNEIDTNVIKLPIIFNEGAYVDMHITFTRNDFSSGFIRLLDTLDDAYRLNRPPAETIMIAMNLYPQSTNPHIFFKKKAGHAWRDHGAVEFPFEVQQIYKFTFKALETELQILLDDVEIKQIPYYVPSKDAKMLHFSNSGMLLNKIEFVGV